MSNTKKANFLQKKAFKISPPVSQALFKGFITEQIFVNISCVGRVQKPDVLFV